MRLPEPARTERQPTRPGPLDGAVVLIVHGSMDRASSFIRVTGELADAHVVTYDRRGYAHSKDAGPPPRTLAGQVDDLLDVLEGRSAIVAGHSFGADIALSASIRAPGQVRAVIAYEPPMPWLPWWPRDHAGSAALAASRGEDPEAAAEGFLRRMIGDAAWERLPERTRQARRSEGDALLADLACMRAGGAVPLDPSEVTVPTVLGCGTETQPHHRANFARLAEVIPHAERVEVPGAGHGCHLSHPAAFAGLVRRAADLARDGGGIGGR